MLTPHAHAHKRKKVTRSHRVNKPPSHCPNCRSACKLGTRPSPPHGRARPVQPSASWTPGNHATAPTKDPSPTTPAARTNPEAGTEPIADPPALGRHRHGQTRIAVEILHTSPAVQLITGLPRSHLLAPWKPCVGCPTSSLHDLITDIADRESALLVPGSWWSPLQAPGVRSSQVHQHGLAVRRANSGCADKAASKRGLPPSCTARDQLPDPAEGVGRASHELWHTHIVAGWCIRLRCLSMALPIVSTPSRPPICGKAPLPESLYPPQRPILLPWTPVPVQKKTPPKDDLQKITMPYQQRQPTSSSPLLTTHSTTASSAMSTHTKGDPRTHHLCTKSQPIPVPSHHADFHPAHIYLHGSTYRDTALCVVEKRHRPPPPPT